MNDMLDLLDLRQEIMERVENVLVIAINYQRKFDCFAHLWQNDRAEILSQFLLYGYAATIDEADGLPESPPTIDSFKKQVFSLMNHKSLFSHCHYCDLIDGSAVMLQIDYYEDLYAEISKLEDFRVFSGWFRVDIKLFKVSLLNAIKKWSWLFKEHLLTHVTNR